MADELDEDNEPSPSYKSWAELLQDDEMDEEEEIESFLQHLRERVQGNTSVSGSATDLAARNIPDYPIYRVACLVSICQPKRIQ